MSFLVNRIYNWVDNSTRDPIAEEKARKEQQAIYTLSKTYKTQLIQDNEKLIARKQTYGDFDNKLLTDLNKSRQSLLDDQTGLNSFEFSKKWTDLSDKYNIVSEPKSNSRYNVYRSLLLAKQLNQDLQNPKPEIKDIIQSRIVDTQKFLNDNAFTDSMAVFDNFTSIIDTASKPLLKDEPTNKALKETQAKLEKNNWHLDFQEEGGPPVPDFVKENTALDAHKKAEKEQDTFSTTRLVTKAFSYAVTIFIILLIIFLLAIGSSFAVNLNIYKPVPFRVLYAIYGCVFSIIVIPYTIFYRWIYMGKPPKYYGFIPLIPRYFVHRPIQFLFGWLTYRPDNSIWDLEEWRQASE